MAPELDRLGLGRGELGEEPVKPGGEVVGFGGDSRIGLAAGRHGPVGGQRRFRMLWPLPGSVSHRALPAAPAEMVDGPVAADGKQPGAEPVVDRFL